MKKRIRFYTSLSRVIPFKYRNEFSKLLIYAGESKINPEHYIGAALFLSFLAFIISLLIPWSLFGFFDEIYAIYGIIAFFIIEIISYLLIYFKAEDRTRRIESCLPDFLQLTSANIKSGMTPFQALKVSARPEFGPLKEEIDKVTIKALGLESFSEALININKRIRSDTLNRVLQLFTSSMKSGGKLASLLEELAVDISQINSLKKEINTTTKSYIMFILFIILLGIPLLLAISLHFIEGVNEINLNQEAGFGFSSLSNENTISIEFLTKISFITLVLTSILSSMLLGAIKEGKLRSGLRYSIFMIIGSLLVFIISRHFVISLF